MLAVAPNVRKAGLSSSNRFNGTGGDISGNVRSLDATNRDIIEQDEFGMMADRNVQGRDDVNNIVKDVFVGRPPKPQVRSPTSYQDVVLRLTKKPLEMAE